MEKNGGLIEQLSSGQWQQDIQTSQRNRIARLQDEQDVQVGVNRYTSVSSVASTTSSTNEKSYAPASKNDSNLALGIVRDALTFEAES